MSCQPPDHSPSYKSEPSFQPLPQFRVILRHSPDQPLMSVVRAVMDLTRFCREEATHRMWESYHRGQSVLLVTHLERAEFLVEAFHHRGLVVICERA